MRFHNTFSLDEFFHIYDIQSIHPSLFAILKELSRAFFFMFLGKTPVGSFCETCHRDLIRRGERAFVLVSSLSFTVRTS